MLLIYTVKYDKSIGSDRGKKTSTQKVKHPLSFEIWIIRNGYPHGDDDLRATQPCLSSLCVNS